MPLNNMSGQSPTSTPSMGATQQPQISPDEILETISHFREWGEILRANEKLTEVSMNLSKIAENVEQLAMNETGDGYDQHTLKRHVKEVRAYAGDFSKLATESQAINFRMNALYEDMGRVLERYFQLQPHEDMLIPPAQGHAEPEITPNLQGTNPLSESEDDDDIGPALARDDDSPNSEGEEAEDGLTPERRMLTTRAIVAMYRYLQKNDPEAAKRFLKLGTKKLKKAAWLLLK